MKVRLWSGELIGSIEPLDAPLEARWVALPILEPYRLDVFTEYLADSPLRRLDLRVKTYIDTFGLQERCLEVEYDQLRNLAKVKGFRLRPLYRRPAGNRVLGRQPMLTVKPANDADEFHAAVRRYS